MAKYLHSNQRGFIKWVLIAVLIIIIGAALLIAKHNRNQPPPPGTLHNQTAPTSGSNSPDRVKQKNGPNGDIHPSSTGTGPGSSDSLLGPQ